MKVLGSKTFLYILLFVCFLSVVWCLRWTFFYQADTHYLENYYSFSQWSIPLSSRIMGDAELYQHSGVLLRKDFQPFSVAPEVPVFGKFLYGLAIQYTGNPLLLSWFYWLGSIVISAYLANKFFGFKKQTTFLLGLLVGTSPMILEQVTQSLMDLPQIVFFLLHMFTLFSAVVAKNKMYKWLLFTISGMSLGAMAGLKFPLYIPLILLVDSWYLLRKKMLLYVVYIAALTGGTYALAYLPYILQEGFLSWLKAQKWMLEFYRSSDVVSTPGMFLVTVISGWYKGWWGSSWQYIPSWDGSWALGMGALIYSLFKLKSKNDYSLELKYSIGILCFISGILLLLPFWPRFIIFLIPLFWILVLKILNNKVQKLVVLFPIVSIILLFRISYNFSPDPFYSLWKTASFEEMYEHFSPALKATQSRNEWVSQQEEILRMTSAYEISLEEKERNSVDFNTKITDLEIIFHGYEARWLKVYETEWQHIEGKWTLNKILEVSEKMEPQLTEQLGTKICVLPSKVNKWNITYEKTAEYLSINMGEAKDRIMKLVPRNYCIPVGYTTQTDSDSEEINGYGIFVLSTYNGIEEKN